MTHGTQAQAYYSCRCGWRLHSPMTYSGAKSIASIILAETVKASKKSSCSLRFSASAGIVFKERNRINPDAADGREAHTGMTHICTSLIDIFCA